MTVKRRDSALAVRLTSSVEPVEDLNLPSRRALPGAPAKKGGPCRAALRTEEWVEFDYWSNLRIC